jgi:hypothetical protein
VVIQKPLLRERIVRLVTLQQLLEGALAFRTSLLLLLLSPLL